MEGLGRAIGCQNNTFPRKKDYPIGVRFYHLYVVISLKHIKAIIERYSIYDDMLILN